MERDRQRKLAALCEDHELLSVYLFGSRSEDGLAVTAVRRPRPPAPISTWGSFTGDGTSSTSAAREPSRWSWRISSEAPAEVSEPWEANVTALLDPASLKWADLVTPGTPIPTPWPKAEYEARQKEIQARRREIRARYLPAEP